ncbi:MAG: type IX secretion system sortase PorU [Bacteroidota bacterium]
MNAARHIALLFFLSGIISVSQSQERFYELSWQHPENINIGDSISFSRLAFEGAHYRKVMSTTPYFKTVIPQEENQRISKAEIVDPVFLPLSYQEEQWLDTSAVSQELIPEVAHHSQRGEVSAVLSFSPFKKTATGYQKLASFTLKTTHREVSEKKSTASVQNSVLRQGSWYKFRIQKDGVYRITYDMLKNWGVDADNMNVNNMGVFGNTNRLLPEMNNEPRPEDLTENPVVVFDGNDGSFDSGDYLLFYGKSPVEWHYNTLQRKFNHELNPFTEYSYYFFTPDQGSAKSLQKQNQANAMPDEEVTSYDALRFFEEDKSNLIKSGREWYGQQLNIGQRKYKIPEFQFDNIVPGSRLYLQTDFAAKATTTSQIDVRVNGEPVYNHTVLGLKPDDFQYARSNNHRSKFDADGSTYEVEFEYNVPTSSAKAWFNWAELSARSQLRFTGKQLHFRDEPSTGNGKHAKFILENANNDTRIWEVTNPLNPKEVQALRQGSSMEFVLAVDDIREFVAFDGSDLKSPEFVEEIENQNLHAIKNIDYLIITHPLFYDQAQRLADFRQEHDGLSYQITTPEKIYNEFSSGGQDVTGIRDFVRHVYKSSDENRRPEYLLLFGNGSFDYRDYHDDNTNFVPTFPSYRSLNTSTSYASDDYFGLLDDSEGLQTPDNDLLIGFLDIGIGRFPADNQEQAALFVDKVIHYETNPETYGSWRNEICLIADDQDNNTHIRQAERLAAIIDTSHRQFNLHKIYMDAYQQVSTPGGQRYPAVNDAIKARMENGVLIMNYTGHGGEVSLAHERIIGIQDIEGWSNYQALPLFITATCEFSRFDDPEIVSAGEKTMLNPGGGSIGLLTTTRLAFSHTNSILNIRVFKEAFKRDENGEYPRLGDLMIASKTPNDDKLFNFVLLGDPAMRLAYPQNEVVTTHVNEEEIGNEMDTLKALSQVTIRGKIQNTTGQKLNQFNGEVFPTVYDKKVLNRTLGQDSDSYPKDFETQNNILYKGKATVRNGEFSFTFPIPKDIDYSFGKGKISYYADSEDTDAGGYYDEVVVGGTAENETTDNEGPEITLYMNDREFKEGDVVNESPMLIADLYDESGLNTAGNGIGHDLLGMMNKNEENVIVLNDFYSAGLDTYKSGEVNYPFNRLPVGRHTITVKAWDIHNNSSEKTIEFIVSDNITPELTVLRAVPNPFQYSSEIHVEHNLFNERMNLTVRIFDISGRLVRTLGPFDKQSDGYAVPPVYWDGKDDNGNYVDKGVYIYSVLVVSKNGLVNRAGGKLIKSE